MISWIRLLRTPHSERFLAQRDGADAAAVDIHHLDANRAVGTVVLFKSANWREEDVESLLQSLDDTMLPGVDLESGSLTYTVVHGDVWGNFEAAADPKT
jgi:hypothetical protein